MMKKEEFLSQIENNCSEITYLSVNHILNKLYKEEEFLEEEEIKSFFSNYKNYHKYLNDFAGVIYNRYGSHINSIYIEMCEFLQIDIDNKYTLEHYIMKLEKQTPELLLGLTNEDIQKQTIEQFYEKLEDIRNSNYFKENFEEFEPRVVQLEKNIELVSKALGVIF